MEYYICSNLNFKFGVHGPISKVVEAHWPVMSVPHKAKLICYFEACLVKGLACTIRYIWSLEWTRIIFPCPNLGDLLQALKSVPSIILLHIWTKWNKICSHLFLKQTKNLHGKAGPDEDMTWWLKVFPCHDPQGPSGRKRLRWWTFSKSVYSNRARIYSITCYCNHHLPWIFVTLFMVINIMSYVIESFALYWGWC